MLLDTAVRANLKHDKTYESLEAFYAANPDCCVLHKWGHHFAHDFRLLGYYEAVADIWCRSNDPYSASSLNPFYHSYVSLNACGEITNNRGISERSSRPSVAKGRS